jgi:hypothetical protein
MGLEPRNFNLRLGFLGGVNEKLRSQICHALYCLEWLGKNIFWQRNETLKILLEFPLASK